MARPASRSRRGRDEDEDTGRRGRSSAPRKPSGPPMGIILGGAGILLVAVIAAFAMGKPKKPIAPPPPPVALKPKVEEAPVARPVGPVKAPPKPLTDQERTYINGLFTKADPHIKKFRDHAKAGWDLKNKGDNDGANEEWIDAKHEYQKAVAIVSEALEDAERFPEERPGMPEFNGRLAGWNKEFAALPKVNTTR